MAKARYAEGRVSAPRTAPGLAVIAILVGVIPAWAGQDGGTMRVGVRVVAVTCAGCEAGRKPPIWMPPGLSLPAGALPAQRPVRASVEADGRSGVTLLQLVY